MSKILNKEKINTAASNAQQTAAEKNVTALLVHHRVDGMRGLRKSLERLLIRTVEVSNCRGVSYWLRGPNVPHLVFTDAVLPDGTWVNVMDLAERAADPVTVIVVSPKAEIDLYIDVMERGAYDFITDSFTARELRHVARCAVERAVSRRNVSSLPSASRRIELSGQAALGRKEPEMG